jgi:large subunit ribosomal protein L28
VAPAKTAFFARARGRRPEPLEEGARGGTLGSPAFWLYCAAVSRVCVICSKRPGTGNNRSHSMVATKRRFDVNLQKIRIVMDGAPVRAYVCTRCLKSGRVQKAV